MPVPRTRQRSIDYGVEARRSVDPATVKSVATRECGRRWAALTGNQKAQFIEELDALLEAITAAEEQQIDAEAAGDAADAARNGDETPFVRFIALSEIAATDYQRTKGAWDTAIECHNTFIQNSVPHYVNADVVTYANQRLADDNQTRIGIGRPFARHRQNSRVPPDLPGGRPDGFYKMREAWADSVSSRDVKKRRRQRQFRHGASLAARHLGGNWQGAWMLDGGAQSYGGRFVQANQHNTVIDRVVEKTTYQSQNDWASMVRFVNDPVMGREPSEAHCHRVLSQITSPLGPGNWLNVPRIRTPAEVNDRYRYYRLSMEYCPHGDLWDFCQNYEDYLPEPFLWRVFHALAQVTIAMKIGLYHPTAALAHPGMGPWDEIVHLDLKPGNIFLAAPSDHFFPAYPTPLVGDFGSAIRTTPTDPLNPNIYLHSVQTRGFVAPEQNSYVDADTLEPVDDERILAHTNIYGIGALMYSIITMNQPRQPEFLGTGERDLLNIWADAPEFEYSWELLYLVHWCLRFKPADRPSPEDLFACITTAIDWGPTINDPHPRNLAQGMEVMHPANLADGDPRELT